MEGEGQNAEDGREIIAQRDLFFRFSDLAWMAVKVVQAFKAVERLRPP